MIVGGKGEAKEWGVEYKSRGFMMYDVQHACRRGEREARRCRPVKTRQWVATRPILVSLVYLEPDKALIQAPSAQEEGKSEYLLQFDEQKNGCRGK